MRIAAVVGFLYLVYSFYKLLQKPTEDMNKSIKELGYESGQTMLEELGFDSNIVSYFSTQSRLFQPIGAVLGIKNTFAVIGQKRV